MTLVTLDRLVDDLRGLGIEPGTIVLAHVSLSRIGTVIGGEQSVIEAMLTAVGRTGTVVMPSQSWQLCDPAYLGEPDDPPGRWQLVRDHVPAYDPVRTPTRTMGKVAELFRHHPEAVRSAHPHRSFAAVGPRAAELLAVHDLDSPNGERSPLKTMYDLGASTVLLGVSHAKSTILHLAEHRSSTLTTTVPNGAPLLVDGIRRWATFDELVVHDHDFEEVGAAFAAGTGLVRSGFVGDAETMVMPQRPLVDFASRWFAAHRAGPPG